MKPQAALLVLAFSLCLPFSASKAEGIKDCDSALIKATYTLTESRFLDWRLAEKVSNEQYNEVKQSASAAVSIYGIPIGADYGEFRKNIDTYRYSKNASLTEETFRNVLWTGLNESSEKAYVACLHQASKKSLLLIPKTATTSDITFDLQYSVIGAAKNPLPVEWFGVIPKGSHLPKKVVGGNNPVLIVRPKASSTLIVSGGGLTDNIIITPLPKIPTKHELLANRCKITETSPPLPDLGANNSSVWTCPRLQAGLYSVRIGIQPPSVKTFKTNSARVGYSLSLEVTDAAGKETSHSLARGQVDIGFPSDMPHTFISTDQTVSVSDGSLVQIKLTITAVADRCCWANTQQHDGSVQIPRGVLINLTQR